MELSYFGSEVLELSIATELVEALRYKLQFFDVPLYGPANIFCDNKSIVTNVSVPTSMLNKCHNANFIHRVR